MVAVAHQNIVNGIKKQFLWQHSTNYQCDMLVDEGQIFMKVLYLFEVIRRFLFCETVAIAGPEKLS